MAQPGQIMTAMENLDLYVANFGANRFYRNDGNGFSERADSLGIGDIESGIQPAPGAISTMMGTRICFWRIAGPTAFFAMMARNSHPWKMFLARLIPGRVLARPGAILTTMGTSICLSLILARIIDFILMRAMACSEIARRR